MGTVEMLLSWVRVLNEIAFFKLFIVGYVFGGRTSGQVLKLFKAVGYHIFN